ncbi:putative tetratricopeptide-like helical domain-containing protein [Rosa chinensis]|uniref:Putative tetratricopeptide-like helical domain-containing protein n=2 Tax=Rosa chinensis TaxID=74649 RepID=A0A2P6QZB8_ROSCH|nr:putative tetratricopeptide-like helical domain-containing protein [Rosa chinensis]
MSYWPDGLFKVNRFEEAFGLVREIDEKGLKLNLVTYNTILNGFCRTGMTNEAMQVFSNMLTRGTKPDAITYNILIYFYCKQGRIKTAIQLFNSTGAAKEWCPDVIAYTSLLSVICNSVGLDQAMVYLDKMIREGIYPNIGTWKPIYILDDILREGSS